MRLKKKLRIKDLEDTFGTRKAGAEEGYKFFSVLVPVVERDGRLHLLYEVRAKHMARQPGEICFPGGELEDGESPKDCALRETWEEIGISSDKIKVISQLDTIYTYSNFIMYCYLGVVDEEALEDVVLNPDEVDEIFLTELDEIVNTEPDLYKIDVAPGVPEDFPYDKVSNGKKYNWRRGWSTVPVYDIDGRVIWGLTARVTKRFADIINERMDEDV